MPHYIFDIYFLTSELFSIFFKNKSLELNQATLPCEQSSDR